MTKSGQFAAAVFSAGMVCSARDINAQPHINVTQGQPLAGCSGRVDNLRPVPAENSIGRHDSLVFFGRELTAESSSSRTRSATPAERSHGSGSKGDERAVAIRSASRSPTMRMREESVLLRRAAFVAVVQATEVGNRHDVAIVT